MPIAIKDRDWIKQPPTVSEILTEAKALMARGIIKDPKILATDRHGKKCLMTDVGAHIFRPDAALFMAWRELGAVPGKCQPAERALERAVRGVEPGQETGECLDRELAAMNDEAIHSAFSIAIAHSPNTRAA